MQVDGFDLVRCRDVLAGTMTIEESLPRLAGIVSVSDPSSCIRYEVSASTEDGRTSLAIRVQGTLSLTCQRCLSVLPFDVDLYSRLLLVGKDDVWPDDDGWGGLEDESCDAIEAEGGLDLEALLEEEILLALPISPRHESCESPVVKVSSTAFSALSKLSQLDQFKF